MLKKNKSLLYFLIIAPTLVVAIFYSIRFLPPKVIVIKYNTSSFSNNSIANVKENYFKFAQNIASSTENTPEILPETTISSPYYLEDFTHIKNDLINNETSFLEINLAEMNIGIYQNGSLDKEVPILTKGDPQGWGGTAAGLYKIINGNTSGFSVIAQAYLPYSLHFYGKYYLHGEPYYADGSKLVSDFSGGCLRLTNNDAKDIYELTEIEMPVLVIDKVNDNYTYKNQDITPLSDISARNYLIGDLDSGFVFTAKNPKKQSPIASITKLMTAIIIAENIDLRKSIEITKIMLSGYGSTEGLEEGKRFRVVELFYPLLIESSNDAAEALSYFLGREKTLQLMREKAKSIQMQDTDFADPSGYDSGNISTAQDLFYLARYVLNNRPPLLEITKGNKVSSFGEVAFDVKNLWNKNLFIDDPTFVGGKTGYTIPASSTAIFIFRLTDKENEERNIAITLLGSENVKADTQKIYTWLQKNYFKISGEIK